MAKRKRARRFVVVETFPDLSSVAWGEAHGNRLFREGCELMTRGGAIKTLRECGGSSQVYEICELVPVEE